MKFLNTAHKMVAAATATGLRLGLIAVFLLSFASVSLAGTFVAFGPQDYIRATGTTPVTNSFTVLNPNAAYTLRIDNGGQDGEFGRVSSAVITLNGVRVARPNDFNQNVAVIEKPVILSLDNVLIVELRSAPGSGITLQIIGVDNDPPP